MSISAPCQYCGGYEGHSTDCQNYESPETQLRRCKYQFKTLLAANDKLENLVKELNTHDGNWMDKWGACRVCGGEIPYGHTDNCDHYTLEKENAGLRKLNENLALSEIKLGMQIAELRKDKERLDWRETQIPDEDFDWAIFPLDCGKVDIHVCRKGVIEFLHFPTYRHAVDSSLLSWKTLRNLTPQPPPVVTPPQTQSGD